MRIDYLATCWQTKQSQIVNVLATEQRAMQLSVNIVCCGYYALCASPSLSICLRIWQGLHAVWYSSAKTKITNNDKIRNLL